MKTISVIQETLCCGDFPAIKIRLTDPRLAVDPNCRFLDTNLIETTHNKCDGTTEYLVQYDETLLADPLTLLISADFDLICTNVSEEYVVQTLAKTGVVGFGCISIDIGNDIIPGSDGCVYFSEALTLFQQNDVTGDIDYTDEDGVVHTAEVISTDINNVIVPGNDGGAFYNPIPLLVSGIWIDNTNTIRLVMDDASFIDIPIVDIGSIFIHTHTIQADSGPPQTITNNDILSVQGGIAINTTTVIGDILVVDLDISGDPGNSLILGVIDPGAYVPPIVSGDIDNSIIFGSDGGAYYNAPGLVTGAVWDDATNTIIISFDDASTVNIPIIDNIGSFIHTHTIAGDSGPLQTITNGDTLSILSGNAGITTVAQVGDNLLVSAVVSTTLGNSLTIDANGLFVPTSAPQALSTLSAVVNRVRTHDDGNGGPPVNFLEGLATVGGNSGVGKMVTAVSINAGINQLDITSANEHTSLSIGALGGSGFLSIQNIGTVLMASSNLIINNPSTLRSFAWQGQTRANLSLGLATAGNFQFDIVNFALGLVIRSGMLTFSSRTEELIVLTPIQGTIVPGGSAVIDRQISVNTLAFNAGAAIVQASITSNIVGSTI